MIPKRSGSSETGGPCAKIGNIESAPETDLVCVAEYDTIVS